MLSFTGAGGFIGGFLYLVSSVLNVGNKMVLPMLTVFILFTLGALLFSLRYYLSNLENQDSPFKLNPLDILLHRESSIEAHYEYRKKQIDKELNIENYEQKLIEINNKENNVATREKQVKDLEERYKNAAEDAPHINLPVDFPVVVDNQFIKLMPRFVAKSNDFQLKFKTFSSEFLDEIDQRRQEGHSDYKILQAYLLAISEYVCVHLFDTSGVRVHFRKLSNDKYEKIVASTGSMQTEDPLKKFNVGEGMIFHAGQLKRSLIKSANLKLHSTGNNDHIWVDYLTLVFDKFFITSTTTPLLSMGISVNNEEAYKNLLYFLNFIKFEQTIQNYLVLFDKKINIKNLISST